MRAHSDNGLLPDGNHSPRVSAGRPFMQPAIHTPTIDPWFQLHVENKAPKAIRAAMDNDGAFPRAEGLGAPHLRQGELVTP